MKSQEDANHAASAGRHSATDPARSAGVDGALAGLAGGVAMALVGALLAFAIGDDIWKAPKMIATFVLSREAVAAPGFVALPVIVGSLIHLALSTLFGVAFGAILSQTWQLPLSYGAPFVFGFVYAVGIWLIAYFLVLPLLNPMILEIYAPAFLIQNLTYGVTLGLTYSMLRASARPAVPTADMPAA